MLLWIGSALASHAALALAACDGAQRIRLRTPVELSAQELAELRALPPLRIFSANTPPMSRLEKGQSSYTGISADMLCFMAQQTGLRYEFLITSEVTVAEKIQQVQDGKADVFVPLSYQADRDRKGIFTTSYYASHYAVIARKGRRLAVNNSADLAKHRVGLIGGVALEPILKGIVPAGQLRSFEASVVGKGLFQALRDDEIDLAVFNKDFFSEERYRYELFDLEIIQTLNEFPRAYSFYFTRSPEMQRVVAAFDRYLAVMDISASLEAHEVGERQLMANYVAQRNQRTLLLAGLAAAVLLALAASVALRRYRNLSRLLASSHVQVLAQQQELQTANEKLAQLSLTDSLTGLANRRHFDQALAREHGRYQRTGAPLSLLMIDADEFKRVNDCYGHTIGDNYLRAVADAMLSCVTCATDLAARYGGEEFVCLLPDTDVDSAYLLAERIRHTVATLDLPNLHAATPHLTISIGLATLRSGNHSAPALLARADTLLYAAKQSGRNRVCAAVMTALSDNEAVPPPEDRP